MSRLALLGGPKAVTLDYAKVSLLPRVPEGAYPIVENMMRSGDISISPFVLEFEQKFADYIGVSYALSVCNGTSAIQEGLFALGVGPGDEVLVPSYTFWSSAGPILACGGVPVFCDVCRDTFCIDPADMARKVTGKTKAAVVVHCWGNPADMDAIMALSHKHGFKVLEDCSHAHGALYKGKQVGSVGDVGCFSMQASKLLPAGEGGVFVTNTREYYERAVLLGHTERIGRLPEDSPYRPYFLTGFGYKHRAHPLGIAIAYAGLDVLDERNAVRNRYGKMFDNALSKLAFLEPQRVLEGCERQYAYHYVRYEKSRLNNISLPTILKALQSEGVSVGSCGYGRLHTAPLFTKTDGCGKAGSCTLADCGVVSLPVTEELAGSTFMAAQRFEKDTEACTELVNECIAAYAKLAENADELALYDAKLGTNYRPPVTGSSSTVLGRENDLR